MPTLTQENKTSALQRMSQAVKQTIHDMKKAAGDKPLKLKVGKHQRSAKMIALIYETDEALRTAFMRYLEALNRIISRNAVKVQVRRRKLSKYFSADRAVIGDQDDLVDGWIIPDSKRQQLKQHAGMILDEARRGLLEILANGQEAAYKIGLGEIDEERGEVASDEYRLKEEHDEQEKFFIGFLTQMRQEYGAVIDGNLEYTGEQYVYESEAELRRRFVEIGDTSVGRLDLYAIAAPESAMMRGIEQAGVENGLKGGIWNTMHDDVVCPDCEALDGHWMTFNQFRKNYKHTLCNGRCRCPELFEPTNDWQKAPFGVYVEY
jgi:hypothetical protein